jgi:hypothetical protein
MFRQAHHAFPRAIADGDVFGPDADGMGVVLGRLGPR